MPRLGEKWIQLQLAAGVDHGSRPLHQERLQLAAGSGPGIMLVSCDSGNAVNPGLDPPIWTNPYLGVIRIGILKGGQFRIRSEYSDSNTVQNQAWIELFSWYISKFQLINNQLYWHWHWKVRCVASVKFGSGLENQIWVNTRMRVNFTRIRNPKFNWTYHKINWTGAGLASKWKAPCKMEYILIQNNF